MPDFLNDLGNSTRRYNVEARIGLRHAQTLRFKSTAKYDLSRPLRNVHEPARPDDRAAELRHVDIAFLIKLAHSEKSHIDTTTAVKIELVDACENRFRVAC